jgi:hypothetical protein
MLPQRLLTIAWRIVKEKPAGDALRQKLEVFAEADDQSKTNLKPEMWMDLAHIVGQAATETNQRREFDDAVASWRIDPNLTVTPEPELRVRHRLILLLRDVAAEVGRLMLIEALAPGSYVLLPPTDLAGAIFTALTLQQISGETG